MSNDGSDAVRAKIQAEFWTEQVKKLQHDLAWKSQYDPRPAPSADSQVYNRGRPAGIPIRTYSRLTAGAPVAGQVQQSQAQQQQARNLQLRAELDSIEAQLKSFSDGSRRSAVIDEDVYYRQSGWNAERERPILTQITRSEAIATPTDEPVYLKIAPETFQRVKRAPAAGEPGKLTAKSAARRSVGLNPHANVSLEPPRFTARQISRNSVGLAPGPGPQSQQPLTARQIARRSMGLT